MKQISIINGPNLNLLGVREPEKYGTESFESYLAQLRSYFNHRATLHYTQSNHEGNLIDALQAAQTADGVVLNAAAYSHTSIALRDTIAAIETPVIEVHITNIYAREPMRHHSYISAVAIGCIAGLGLNGYKLAIEHLINL